MLLNCGISEQYLDPRGGPVNNLTVCAARVQYNMILVQISVTAILRFIF